MKKLFYAIISLFFSAAINSLELVPFSNSGEDISFQYPKNWFIKELKYNNPYEIFISDTEIKKETDIFKTGITIAKFYHQSWQFNFDPDINKTLESLKPAMKESILNNKNNRIVSEEIIEINGLKYLKYTAIINESTDNITSIYYSTVHNDSYLMITLESPAANINEVMDYFNDFMNKSVFFTSNRHDNHYIDSHSLEIATDFMKMKPDDEDMEKKLNLMSLAIKMNPEFPFLYLGRAFVFIKVCQGMKGEKQKELAEFTIKDYARAAESLIKYRNYLIEEKFVEEKDIIFYLTDCYYKIAEIYRYALKDKKNARAYYEKALEITDDREIRKSLKSL